ncbi:ribonuclease R [Larsenimonas suaedae]|uniref:Ribonuclease R n=1 Tax=Larsenimonas suaedae TaxID=1851019 RepID=A0ABU1GTR4_9GAMM|nr:ribonuclease R [Larsenimonas suaedae]MCM2971861.1 ribonuclease R [Larsenimonas suaedae]MDR5895413.1 ribonuclease R [Larsenimonas suaedae]
MKHWTLSDDPQAEREAQNYENPVPSREFLFSRVEAHGKPISADSLNDALGLTDEDQREGVRRRLIAMDRDGQLKKQRDNSFTVIPPEEIIEGRVIGHRDGIGFLVRDDGEKPDLVIPSRQMQRVFHGDRVRGRISGRDRRGRAEVRIMQVLAHNTETVVGVYRVRGADLGVLVPENSRISQDIIIPAGSENGAKDGQIVEVRLTQQPAVRTKPEGEVIEVMGERMDPGLEIDIAIREHDIPATFPSDVLEQIESLSDQVREEDKHHRVDLRDLPLVTIDGEDAKDFDDAVYSWKTKSGSTKLIVAIADVSHYVPVDSPLDREAIERGNSVYFPGQVVPMLPEILSNGLCSLNPDVDRLCMVCEMNISQKGEISRYRFYEGVMRSHARLTYTDVGTMLQDADSEQGQALRKHYHNVVKPLEQLYELYHTLRSARQIRGAIDFETTETQIVFNDDRKIERIVPRERNDAHKLIEECMLAANVATARFLEKHKLPALYRVHDSPKSERLTTFKTFLGELGLTLEGGEKPTPRDFQQLRQLIQDRPDADIIQTIMLRTMNQAIYTPHNEGHFGLAYSAYAHFTSPIRRYPDLLVHRAIRGVIRSEQASTSVLRVEGAPSEPLSKWCPYTFEQMVELGEHCSMTERRADDATRDVEDWLKCEFMSDKVGETFDGTIASVTQFGLFVRLDAHFVEGLVHISSLPSDYYRYEETRFQLKGERGGMIYRLGDGVVVRVARVDLDDRKLDFELAVAEPTSRRRARKTRSAPEASDAPASDNAETPKKKRKSRPGKKERARRKKSADKTGDSKGGDKGEAHSKSDRPKKKKSSKKDGSKKSDSKGGEQS